SQCVSIATAASVMSYRKSSEYGVLLTTLSQNKQAPKWSMGGRSPTGRRPSTPGPGAYSNQSGKRTPSYGFGSSGRDGPARSSSVVASPGPGAYGTQAGRPRSAGPAFGHARRGWGRRDLQGPGAYVPNYKATRFEPPRHTCTPRREGVRPGGGPVLGTPGPGTYGGYSGYGGECDSPVSKAAPRWGFGSSNRGVHTCGQSPGPGQYDLRSLLPGPKFSIRCRNDVFESGSMIVPSPGPGSFGGLYTQFGY
ncbi:unnamed protein product, partial [Durusdinium trenchii]